MTDRKQPIRVPLRIDNSAATAVPATRFSEYNRKQLETMVEEYEKRYMAALNSVRVLKDEKDKVFNSNLDLRRRLQQYDAEIRAAQLKSFQDAGDASFTGKEDSAIRNEFVKLQDMIKEWAKKNAVLYMDEVKARFANTTDANALTHELGKVARLTADGRLPAEHLRKKAPYILLNALLAYEVCVAVFDDPFYARTVNIFTAKDQPSSVSNSGESQMLHNIYEELKLSRILRQPCPLFY